MLNFIQRGLKIQVTAPEGGLNSGDLVKSGDKIFVVETGAVAGEIAVCLTEGVVEVAKANVAIGQGQLVYYDAANKVITTVSANNTFAGYAFSAAAAADLTVQYRIR